MDMFKMIKEAAALRGKLSQMDKALKEKMIDVSVNGVSIRINAKSEIVDLKLTPEMLKQNHGKIEKDILAAISQAIKRSHDVMTEEAKKLTGGMNIPGLM